MPLPSAGCSPILAPVVVAGEGSPVASDASQQQALQHLPPDHRRRSVDTDKQALPRLNATPRDRRPTPQRSVTDDASSSISTFELVPAARPVQWRLPSVGGFASDLDDASGRSVETAPPPPPLLGCPPIVPVTCGGRSRVNDGDATPHSRRVAGPAIPEASPLAERVSRWLADVGAAD